MRLPASIRRVRITSVDDSRLDDFRILSDPALMRDRGLFVAEGRLAVERLLASRFRTRALLVIDSALAGLAATLAGAAAGNDGGLDVYVAESADLRLVTGFRFHRGCLALGERPDPESEAPELPPVEPGRPLVVLEGVSDPDNVGSVFRNAAAFGAAGVVLSPTCADPLYRKAIRTSMGTTLQLPFRVAREWPGVLEQVRDMGLRVVALTPLEPATEIEAFCSRSRAAPVALLLGNEGDGVSGPALALCDERVRIDIEPAVDSLNVANAAAIALQRIRAAGRGPR
jgi:tRNA G18 (ribose-2'-O)-methylase SpoU